LIPAKKGKHRQNLRRVPVFSGISGGGTEFNASVTHSAEFSDAIRRD
jgi:hypothetical protein